MSAMKITKDNFDSQVLGSEKPVLVDFFAGWCGPCRMLSPIVDEIAGEHPEIKVCKVDADEELELTMRYRIVSLPTLLVVKNGEVVKRSVGAMPKDDVLELLQ